MDNYVKKLLGTRRAGLLPASDTVELEVRYDYWCGVVSGKPCDCEPEIAGATAFHNLVRAACDPARGNSSQPPPTFLRPPIPSVRTDTE